jgi:hypothetical protein
VEEPSSPHCLNFLVDIGANIGMFTVAVAAMGRKVKAVDAGFANHAYMRYGILYFLSLKKVSVIDTLVNILILWISIMM